LIAIFNGEIAKRFLVQENGYRSAFAARWRLLDKLYQVIPSAESEIAFIESIYFIAVVKGERAANLVAEHVLWYELLSFPAPGIVAGIHDLWFVLFLNGHITRFWILANFRNILLLSFVWKLKFTLLKRSSYQGKK
jgi:hypothetical protein